MGIPWADLQSGFSNVDARPKGSSGSSRALVQIRQPCFWHPQGSDCHSFNQTLFGGQAAAPPLPSAKQREPGLGLRAGGEHADSDAHVANHGQSQTEGQPPGDAHNPDRNAHRGTGGVAADSVDSKHATHSSSLAQLRQFYDEATADKLYSVFRKDFELLGYPRQFPS
jgi:hypothetical protein